MVEHILSAIDNINDVVTESTIDVNLALVNEYCKEAAILYNSKQFYQESGESGKKESIFRKILNGLKRVFEIIVNKLGNLKSKFTASKLGKAIEKWKKSVKRKIHGMPELSDSDSINNDYKPSTKVYNSPKDKYQQLSPEIIRENIDLEKGTIRSCVFNEYRPDEYTTYEKFVNRVDDYVKEIGECTNKLLSDPNYTAEDFSNDCSVGPILHKLSYYSFMTPIEFETFLLRYKKLIEPVNRIYSESKQTVSILDTFLNNYEKYSGYILNDPSDSDRPFKAPMLDHVAYLTIENKMYGDEVEDIGRIVSELSSKIGPMMSGLKMLEMEAKVLTEILDKQSNESNES